MVTVRLKGYITEDGEVKIFSKVDLPPGDFEMIATIENTEQNVDIPPTWSDAELEAFKNEPVTPLTGVEIAEWLTNNPPQGWEQVTDSEAFIQEMRRKKKAQNTW